MPAEPSDPHQPHHSPATVHIDVLRQDVARSLRTAIGCDGAGQLQGWSVPRIVMDEPDRLLSDAAERLRTLNRLDELYGRHEELHAETEKQRRRTADLEAENDELRRENTRLRDGITQVARHSHAEGLADRPPVWAELATGVPQALIDGCAGPAGPVRVTVNRLDGSRVTTCFEGGGVTDPLQIWQNLQETGRRGG